MNSRWQQYVFYFNKFILKIPLFFQGCFDTSIFRRRAITFSLLSITFQSNFCWLWRRQVCRWWHEYTARMDKIIEKGKDVNGWTVKRQLHLESYKIRSKRFESKRTLSLGTPWSQTRTGGVILGWCKECKRSPKWINMNGHMDGHCLKVLALRRSFYALFFSEIWRSKFHWIDCFEQNFSKIILKISLKFWKPFKPTFSFIRKVWI